MSVLRYLRRLWVSMTRLLLSAGACDRLIFPARKPAARRCCYRSMGQTDGRTDGRTPGRYIDPPRHIIRAASVTTVWLAGNPAHWY